MPDTPAPAVNDEGTAMTVADPFSGSDLPVEKITAPDPCILVLRVPDGTPGPAYRQIGEGLARWADTVKGVVGCIMLDEGQSIDTVPLDQLHTIGLQTIPTEELTAREQAEAEAAEQRRLASTPAPS